MLHISFWGVEAFFGWLSGEGSEFWAPVAAWTPLLGGMECGRYGFVVAIWQQKRIRVKLNNGLLTNENEDTDTEFHQIILRLVSY